MGGTSGPSLAVLFVRQARGLDAGLFLGVQKSLSPVAGSDKLLREIGQNQRKKKVSTMRLFHVSEESDIPQFIPRIPIRKDLDQSKGLVWAINEKCLPNFLTPRDCPRTTYHASAQTTSADIERFFSSTYHHCMIIEQAWYERMKKITLYVYEFDPTNFYMQDEAAGYYVSEQTEMPIGKIQIDNVFDELFKKKIEIRLINNLWQLADAVAKSTLNFSICDMANAQARV